MRRSKRLENMLAQLHMLQQHELAELAAAADNMSGRPVYKAGVLWTAQQMDVYILPAIDALHELKAIATFCAGLAMASGGDRVREQLRITANDLGAQMAIVITTYANARRSGADMPTPDLSRAQQLFEAITSYIEGKATVEEIRALIVTWNGVYVEHQRTAQATRPGVKPSQLSKAFNRDLYRLVDGDGLTIDEAIAKLAQIPKYDTIWDAMDDPLEAAKKRLQRHRRK